MLFLGLSASCAAATTWTVSDTSDNPSDSSSVRYAIGHAQSGDTVAFANTLDGQAIVLTNGPLSISSNITVQGPGARLLTISGGNSAAVFSIASGTVTISGLTILNGHAASTGGGILISGGTVTITACAFASNSATSGGAIANSGTLTISNSSFSGNSASTLGGGIQNSGTLTVTNSTFSGNSAETSGGGIYSGSGTVVLNNSTLSANTAGTSGGGIFNNISNSPAPTITATNTIIAANTTGGVLGADDCDNCGTQSASNLIGGTPQLGALGWNGGPTQTMIPIPGSTVIGAGIYQTGEPATDQRGFKRPSSANAQIDLGAVQTSYHTVTALTDNSSGSCGSTCTLRAALTTVSSGGSADIVFAAGLVSATSPGTIALNGSLPAVTGHLNFTGPGADELTIAGQSSGTVSGNMITVNAGADALFFGITLYPSGGNAVNLSQGIANAGTLVLSNSTVSGTNATGVANSGTLIISTSSMTNNSSAVSNSGVAIVNDSTISGSNTGGTGGGIANTSILVMNRDSLTNNYSEDGGGGLYNGGTATVLNSTFSGNYSNINGGAITNNSSLTISNSSFYSNLVRNSGSGSGYGGGAIYNGDTLSIASSTFSSNTSQASASAGGVANFGSALTMTNSVLFNDGGGDCNGDGCPQNGVSGNVVGVSNISLSPLGSHGGSTATMIPTPGSAAICAGSPALLPSTLTSDQRGFPRLNTTYSGYTSSSPCLDAGAVQTNYTSVSFVQQPTDSVAGEAITPAPTLQVVETNTDLSAPDNTDPVNDISVTMAFQGTGALEGTTIELSSGGVATFNDLIVNQAGSGDTLTTSLPVVAGTTLTATSSSFNVTTVAGNPATHFAITGPSTAIVGMPFSITVTAQDANNQTATGYNGTVHFTSSDAAANLPANATISSGVGTFTITLYTAANPQSITVTDTTHSTITGTISLAVNPGPASKIGIVAPATAVTGAPINLTVTAYDVGGNVATGYSGTLHFTSTDTAATLPADSTLFQGTGSFVATLVTLGTQTITATDTESVSITGVSGGIVVGSPFNLVVTTAADDAGNAANCTMQSQPGVGKDAACSLRDAIAYVNNSSGGVITFDSKVFASTNSTAQNTITVTSPLAPSEGMTIQGPGANVVTISGAGTVGVFVISGPGTVLISGLTIAKGYALNGGGIENGGTLIVNDCLFAGNTALGSYNVNSNPVFANGGAIENEGTLTVNRSAFIGNGAFGDSNYEDTLSGSGGAIFNLGTATLNNSTFSGNTAYPPGDGTSAFAGEGGAVHNLCGTIAINNSTISGNSAQGPGGGVYNNPGYAYACPAQVTITNTIVAGNTAPTTGDDCDSCGTQSTYNLISTPSNIISPPLAAPGNYGGPTQTMLPLPGGAAICAGSSALIPTGITTDQRGFPRLNTTYTGFSSSKPCVDLGAVQTNFQSVQFTNAGSGYSAVTDLATGPTPTPIVSVTESQQNIGGVPVTLTFTGTGTATGLGPVTTVSGVGASFGTLSVSAPGTDTLSATIQVTPAYSIVTDPDATLTVTANTVSPPTLQMAFGAASIPITSATTLTFTLNNPNANAALTSAVFSDTLPSGLVVTTPNSLSNTCGGTATAAAGSTSITLAGGTIPKASSCVVSVSITGTTAGSYTDTSSQLTTAQIGGNSASASITVAALTVTHFSVSAPATATAGTPFTFTVQALDDNNAPVTSYSTTLHFTSSDQAATLPANSPLINGVGTYTATLRSTGSQNIVASDTVNTALTGTSSGTVVSALNLVVTTSSDDAGNMANCTPQANPAKGTDASCSLRDALLYAASIVTGSITFDETAFATAQTIELGSAGTFNIPGNTTITGRTSGSGSQLTNLVTVSGAGGANSQDVVFSTSGNNVTITSLIITNGGPGGLISNSGVLTINSSTLSNTTSQGTTIGNSNQLTLIDSTISGNNSGSNSILSNGFLVTLSNDTISGNSVASNQAVLNNTAAFWMDASTVTGNSGGVILANTDFLNITNSILAGDTGQECTSTANSFDTCPPDGLNGNIVGETVNLSALGNYGGPTQTVVPLPGTGAICRINPSTATGTDQRGFSRTTTYGTTTCQDTGAVQTNYSIAFVQQPSTVAENAHMSPAPTVQLSESGNGFTAGAVTIPLSLTGKGTLSGGSVATSTSNGLATYSALSINALGSGDTLTANLTLDGSIAISSGPSQAFDVTAAAQSQTISFTLASPVTYGVAPIALSATATSGLAVSFSVLSGPGIISGNTLTVNGVGSIVVAANQAGNTTYSAAPQVTQTLVVNGPALTITANNATRVYGTANPTFSGTVTGAKNGDTFTESFTTTATITSNVGTYPIVPSVSGANLGDYTEVIKNGTLSITQAASSTAFTVSSTSITPGQSITLSAQVTSATSGTPTGTVSFYDGTSMLGTVALSAGTCSYATTSLAAGMTHTLTAVYGGDTNFTGSNASAGTTVTVAPLDFTLTLSGSSTLNVAPGGSVSYSFTLDPLYGSYAGPVSFSITGLPTGATATFSPSTVAANAGKQTVTLAIQVPSTTAMQRAPSSGTKLPPITLAILFLPLFAAGRMRRCGRVMSQMLGLLSLALICASAAALLTGCGGHSGSSTPSPQNYTLTVTATSGNIQQSSTIKLDVQ